MAERVLSRHVLRRRARARERHLEHLQRTVRNWLRDEYGDWKGTAVPEPMPAAVSSVTGGVSVPPEVRAAEEALIAAGTFHTDTIMVKARKRGMRFAVVAEN